MPVNPLLSLIRLRRFFFTFYFLSSFSFANENPLSTHQIISILSGVKIENSQSELINEIQNSPEWEELERFKSKYPSAEVLWNSRQSEEFQQNEQVNHPARGNLQVRANKISQSYREAWRTFSKEKLSEANQESTGVFYPFGGPDTIFPTLLFPNMKKLILVGLEDIGTLPNIKELHERKQLVNLIRHFGHSIYNAFELGYFPTKTMHREFGEYGVIGIASSALLLMGAEIISIENFSLGEDGSVIPDPDSNYAFRLRYRMGSDQQDREVYYFKQELQKIIPGRSHPFRNFLNNQSIQTSYLKATNYSLFDHFEKYQSIVLYMVKQKYIVQSDCGIPFATFNYPEIEVDLFGQYAVPNRKLGSFPMWELRSAYAEAILNEGSENDIELFKQIHGTDAKFFKGQNKTKLSWRGYLPSGYDYPAGHLNANYWSTYRDWGNLIFPNSKDESESGRRVLSNLIYVRLNGILKKLLEDDAQEERQ